MIVKLAAPIAGARGTLGGVVFSENGAGPYVKPWAPPSQPQSENQTQQRSLLAQIPALWTALSPAQKTAWDAFADLPAQDLINPLGETYSISGFGWFTKCNTRLLVIGRATIQATPVIARPAAPAISGFFVTPPGTNTNLALGATATASSETLPQFPASEAFDGVQSAAGNAWVAQFNVPQWIAGELAAGTAVVRHYTIWARTVAASVPKDWTFEGWNGASYDILDTVVDASFTLTEANDYFFDNEVSHTKYRLNISACANPAQKPVVGELEMFADEEGASCIHYPVDEFASHDLVLFISQAATPNRTAFYSGFLSVIQTQAPGNTATFFQDLLDDIFGTISTDRSFGCRLYRQTSEGIRSAPATAVTVS